MVLRGAPCFVLAVPRRRGWFLDTCENELRHVPCAFRKVHGAAMRDVEVDQRTGSCRAGSLKSAGLISIGDRGMQVCGGNDLRRPHRWRRILGVVENHGVARIVVSGARQRAMAVLMPTHKTGGAFTDSEALLGAFRRLDIVDEAVRMQDVVRTQDTGKRAANYRAVQDLLHLGHRGKYVVAGVTLLMQNPLKFVVNVCMDLGRQATVKLQIAVRYKAADLLVREQS